MARAVQVVPGSRVRISPKWVGLSLTLLAAALAVSRVGKSWRLRERREKGCPNAIRLRMRKGYMSGRGDMRSREIHLPPATTCGLVALCYEGWLALAAGNGDLGGLPFPSVVHGAYVMRFGVPSLAERALHDLYFNCRLVCGVLPRVRLFCIFSGFKALPVQSQLGKREKNPSAAMANLRTDQERVLSQRCPEALAFYVNAILLVRKKKVSFL